MHILRTLLCVSALCVRAPCPRRQAAALAFGLDVGGEGAHGEPLFPDRQVPRIPPSLVRVLKEHQKAGLRFVWEALVDSFMALVGARPRGGGGEGEESVAGRPV